MNCGHANDKLNQNKKINLMQCFIVIRITPFSSIDFEQKQNEPIEDVKLTILLQPAAKCIKDYIICWQNMLYVIIN